MIDLRQTPEYTKYMESIGWIVERKNGVNYFIKKFPLIGSFIKIQRPGKINFNQIENIAKKYKAFQIVIEPINTSHQSLSEPEALESRRLVTNHGFRLCRNPFVPAKTIHIDLTKSEKQLLKEMHYKTRYNIKKFHRSLITIHHSQDIMSFADFWQECAKKQRGMYMSQKKEIIELYKTFKGKADLILVSNPNHPRGVPQAQHHPRGEIAESKLLSGILMVRTKDIAYYMYAAASSAGKKLFAPTLAVWESIKLAKKLGCILFDFEGIYDERFPLKSWQGFTRFKKSFGGKEVTYPGAFVKYRLPI